MTHVARAEDRRGSKQTLALVAVAVLAAAFLLLAAIAPPPARAATLRIGVVNSSISANARNAGGSLNGYYSARVSALGNLMSQIGTVGYLDDNALTSLATLERYDVVVGVRWFATTEAQRVALRSYVARGGGLVTCLDLSHWDYAPSRSPQYDYFGGMWGFYQSDFMSRSFEWGEVSELVDARFVNDPYMYPGYYVNTGPASSHPILGKVGQVSIQDPGAQYNELVQDFGDRSILTPLAYYGRGTSTKQTPNDASGWLAGWAVNYYYGRVAYYGFQLGDLAAGNTNARRLLQESAKWAGASGYSRTYGNVVKTASLSANVWYWGNSQKICVDEYLGNVGNVQLRGTLGCQIYDPYGTRVFSDSLVVPISPHEGYTYGSWQLPSPSPVSGTWRAHLWYSYYDYLRGGVVSVNRDVYFRMSGQSVAGQSNGPTIQPGGNLTGTGTRIAGVDRVETSLALSRTGWPNGVGSGHAVVLARSDMWADALAAAPLAGKHDAPIILTPTGAITDSVRAELKRLFTGATGATATVYVVSMLSDAAVSQATSAVASAGIDGGSIVVKRLAGHDQYDTAANIAREAGCPTTGTFANAAIIAPGASFADALSISALAAKERVPILFTGTGSVPAATGQALRDLGVKHSLIVGGTAVVGTAVESSLEGNGYRVAGVAMNTHSPDTRIAGSTRYDTSLSALDYGGFMGGLSAATRLYLATGTNYPDALSLGPLAAKQSTGVLLVNGSNMGFSPSVGGYLSGRRTTGSQVAPVVTYVGGSGAIAEYVRGQVSMALHR